MNTQKKARSLYWDIVKGWGIIAIVLGHTGYFAGAFVYLFHLALFFFITGYFYNETKYGDTPFLYFGSRLAGAWPRYMFYTLFFVLLHNFFVTHRLYAGQELYNHTRMLTAWMSSLSFNSPERFRVPSGFCRSGWCPPDSLPDASGLDAQLPALPGKIMSSFLYVHLHAS